MTSNTRSNRRPAALNASTSQYDVAALSNIERLLLAQAVHEVGANAWPNVAKILSKHPLLSRPKSFFNAQSCHAMYNHLMDDAELEITDANNSPKNSTNLMLAQRHYGARVVELRELILGEEEKFKRLLAEIEEIRSGLWDDKITAKISGVQIEEPAEIIVEEEQPPPESTEAQVATDTIPELPQPADTFGSDLSGVTESDDPPKALEESVEIADSEAHPIQHVRDEELSAPVAEPGAPDLNEREDEAIVTPVFSPTASSPNAIEEAAQKDVDTIGLSPDRPSAGDHHIPSPTLPEELEGTLAEDQTDGSVMEVDDAVDLETPKEDDDEGPQSPPVTTTSRRREGKRKVSDIDVAESQRDKKRAREESQPIDEDDGGSGPTRRRRGPTEEQVANKRFQNVIGMLHSQISQHRNGNIFHNPIKASEAPDYRDIVKRPMDLKTIKARIKDGVISNSLEFQRDVYLMFANSMMYNRPDSDIYTMAEEMMLESEGHINAFRQTEGLIGGHVVSRSAR